MCVLPADLQRRRATLLRSHHPARPVSPAPRRSDGIPAESTLVPIGKFALAGPLGKGDISSVDRSTGQSSEVA